jgi:hypothetical protein
VDRSKYRFGFRSGPGVLAIAPLAFSARNAAISVSKASNRARVMYASDVPRSVPEIRPSSKDRFQGSVNGYERKSRSVVRTRNYWPPPTAAPMPVAHGPTPFESRKDIAGTGPTRRIGLGLTVHLR